MAQILSDIGLRPVDVGPLSAALALEHMAFLNRPVLRRPIESALTAVVAVDHGARGSAAPAQTGHLEGVDDQLGAQMVSDRPAHDAE